MTDRLRHFILATFLLAFAGGASAQSISRVYFEPDEKFAKYCILFKNYTEGLSEYMRLIEKDSNNVLYRYHIGLCHVNLNKDKSQAIPWLEWVVKQPKYDVAAWYELGRAYLYTYRFDEAEKAFKQYQQQYKGKEENEIPAARYLEMISNAREAMKTPINISLKNAGREINSRFPEYGAYVNAEEDMLLYNSQRFGNTGNFVYYDGQYTSDIWASYYRNGRWKRAKRFSPVVNSALIEDIVSMSPDGSKLVLFYNNFKGENMIFTSQKRGKSWNRPVAAEATVNSEHSQYGACVTPDNQFLFFSSDRPGGMGKKDLYLSRRLPSGEWGPPENLGEHINTPYNEDMPYLAPDGHTLYFCSQGHNSMGDHDIFRTTWDRVNNSFSTPENLGYPLNTTHDDRTISFTKSGRYAYISTNRGDGEGDLDIYRVTFHDVKPVYTVFRGTLLTADSVNLVKIHEQRKEAADKTNAKLYSEAAKHYTRKDSLKGNKILEDLVYVDPELDADVKVYYHKTDSLYGRYRPNAHTGNYVIVLPPGRFRIVFSYAGYSDFEVQPLVIEDRDNRDNSIIDYIFLDDLNKEKRSRHSLEEQEEYFGND